MEVKIKVICEHLPGATGGESKPVYLGIQRGSEVTEAVPANRKRVVFEPSFRVYPMSDGKTNFLGPYARGTPTERFFYLSWVVKDGEGHLKMFRRAKIHLSHISWPQVEEAIHSNKPLSVTLSLTDKRGGPRCGSIRSDEADWR